MRGHRNLARLTSRALALLCAGVLLLSAGLSVSALLLDDPAARCCSGGRCCCAGAPGPDDGHACFRRACGCGASDGVVLSTLLRAPALLPAGGTHSGLEPEARLPLPEDVRLLGPAREPTVPPPRPSLPA